MADKDFLSQFSEEGKKPDSFKEEVLTPVAKERKPLNKGLLAGIIVLLIIIIFLIWWLFLRARIEMPNFVRLLHKHRFKSFRCSVLNRIHKISKFRRKHIAVKTAAGGNYNR